MNTSEEFYRIFRQLQSKQEEDTLPPCPIAAQLSEKLNEVVFTPLARLGEGGITRAHIAQAKLFALDEWKAWEKSTPKHHFLGRHQCLGEVFDQVYTRLHLMELQLRPRLAVILDYDELTKPVQLEQAQPPVRPISGIFLGETDE